MVETFEEKKRQSREHFQATASQKIDETTPSVITDPIRKFAGTLGSEPVQFVPVVDDPNGLFGWCADGVLEKVRHDSGSICFGWCLWELPRILLTAEFHAVWRDASGTLADITPKPHGEKQILFIPDLTYPADFDFDQRPRNSRVRLYESSNPVRRAADHFASMKPAQRVFERKRAAKAGLTVEQWLVLKRPAEYFPELIDEFIRVCDKCDRLLDEIPGLGNVTATPELIRAHTIKMKLLSEIKRIAM